MMRRVRLFYAAAIPDSVRAGLVDRFSSAAPMPGLRFVSSESLHITLRFLGEVPENRVAEAVSSGSAVRQRSFELTIESGGTFPSAHQARHFWAGVGGDVGALRRLADDLNRRLADAGFRSEVKPYRPHVTLARTRGGGTQGPAATAAFKALIGPHRSEPFAVKEFHLYQSHLGPTGSRYDIMATFPLA